ncbi:MAG TPA: T9SS type A sorting domain-containing protein [Ignavibacteria bacterium]
MKKIIFKSVIFLSSLIIVLVSVIIILSFNTNDESKINTSNSGWQLQTNLQTLLNGRTITDMTFIDSLTGFAVTNTPNNDTGFILKTTNGGNNWFINFNNIGPYGDSYLKISFITDSIGYSCGGGGFAFICKTTNKGNTWIKNSYSWATAFLGMSILGKDTIYVVDDDGLVGGVFRSTNGGQNWQNIYSAGMYNPMDIYMFNGRIGFYKQDKLYKTLNGGFSWFNINDTTYWDIYFLDSSNGYRVVGAKIEKTTNGGYNWIAQTLPNIPGGTTNNDIRKLFFIKKDTIWAVGGYVQFHNPNRDRGTIYKTTNGGINWGYQLPDTHIIQISRYYLLNFKGYESKYGWAYNPIGLGVNTITGGDTTFFVGINKNTSNIPNDFLLEQNYPNPFNSKSKIKYQINKEVRSQKSEVKLKVFDILGKEIITLVNETKYPGSYEISFDGSNLSSGIYFYSLFIDGKIVDAKEALLIK